MATAEERYDQMSTDELFDILRREILAARLKVALDEELNRSSTPMQKRLASMSCHLRTRQSLSLSKARFDSLVGNPWQSSDIQSFALPGVPSGTARSHGEKLVTVCHSLLPMSTVAGLFFLSPVPAPDLLASLSVGRKFSV